MKIPDDGEAREAAAWALGHAAYLTEDVKMGNWDTLAQKVIDAYLGALPEADEITRLRVELAEAKETIAAFIIGGAPKPVTEDELAEIIRAAADLGEEGQ